MGLIECCCIVVKCCIHLDDCVSSFTPKLCLVCCVRVGTLLTVSCVFCPVCNLGLVCCCVKVRWRNPAGEEDSPNQLKSRQKIEPSGSCGRTSASGVPQERARQIWFRSGSDGVKEWETQEEETSTKEAAIEDLQICHLQMPRVLDGRSVLEH